MNWAIRTSDSVMQRQPILGTKWAYEWGVVLKGIESVWRYTGDARYLAYIKRSIDHYVQKNGGINTYRLDEYNIDHINTGKLLFELGAQTNDPRYERAIQLLRGQLRDHPRTPEGGFWHKQIYPQQMWLDGIYMGGPFYAAFAHTFDEHTIFDDLARQITLITAHTRDASSGLLVHGWDSSRQQDWADPQSGRSPHFWGRAMGWFVMALADIFDFFPAQHPQYLALRDIFRNAIDALLKVQHDGVWYQILDQPERAGNYPEASASCMFVYAIAKGARRGILTPSHFDVAVSGFTEIISRFIEVDDDGLVSVNGICSVAGLGGDPYRDGSFEYYISEPVVTNDDKGVGAFILVAAEMELAEHAQ